MNDIISVKTSVFSGLESASRNRLKRYQEQNKTILWRDYTMKKTMKVLDVLCVIRFLCYLETDIGTGEKAYRLVMLFPRKDRNGYPTKHRKTVGLFEFFGDVLATVSDIYRVYINYKPYNAVISWCESFDRRKPY